MTRVQWTDTASESLAAIILDRRQRVGFVAARALRQRITERVYLLRTFPELGRPRSEKQESRELVVTPYIIPYEIVDDTVLILNIFDGRSIPPNERDDALQ